MASDFSYKIDGLEELQNRLSAMGQEMAAKSIVGAAYSSNKQMLDAIQSTIVSNGSVDTGLLRDSITRKKLIYDKSGRVVIITGVNKSVKGVDSKGRPRVPWRYAHLVEKTKPFMKPACERVRQAVIDEFIIHLLKKIKRFEKKGR